MEYRNIKGFSGWMQVGFLFAFTAIGFLLTGVVQFYLGNKALGPNNLPLAERSIAMMQAIMRPENAIYAQLSQIFGTFFLLFLPSFLFILVCYKKLLWAGFSKYFTFQQVVIGFLIILTTNFLAIPFEGMSKTILANFPHWDMLAKKAEQAYNDQIAAMSTLKTWPQFVLAIFIIAFLPALFEEFFFRGVIQNLLVRWLQKPVIAIIITSLIFSYVHSSYYLFISRFILGYTLGLLFYQCKNIWVNTFAHFLNNFMGVIQLFVISRTSKTGKVDLDAMTPDIPTWSLVITFAVLIGLFIQFERISHKKKIQIEEQENLAIMES